MIVQKLDLEFLLKFNCIFLFSKLNIVVLEYDCTSTYVHSLTTKPLPTNFSQK